MCNTSVQTGNTPIKFYVSIATIAILYCVGASEHFIPPSKVFFL